jgi:hypothetical protein
MNASLMVWEVYMNRTFRLLTAAAVIFASVSALEAQNVKIDARMNVLASDKANYLTWSLGNKDVKDSYDAATSASVKGSTTGLNAIRYDSASGKKAAIPVGLRDLLLFPVSDFGTQTADALVVTENGKALTVRYVHRGSAYELSTDASGKFDVLTGAKYAKGLTDNVGGQDVIKSEFLKAGGDPKKMGDLDWSKIPLVPDTKDSAAKRWYEGSLSFAYSNGILSVKGNLSEKK